MKAIDIDEIDIARSELSIDVRDTCAFLTSVAMRSEGSPEFDGVGGGLEERLERLAQVCGQLGLAATPLTACYKTNGMERLDLADFIRLLARACREGVIEAAHLDMVEDLHALERGICLEDEDSADKRLGLSEFVDALEDRMFFGFLFVDPLRAELLRVDDEAWDGASEVLLDHGRAGMSEETALWVVRKHMREEVEVSDEELTLAVRACLLDLDPVRAPEDYTMLSYIEEALEGVEDGDLRARMKVIVDCPENVHRMQEAFDEARLKEEGRALLRASMEIFAREWLDGQGIAWR